MKKQFIIFCGITVGVFSVYSLAQDLIKPKTKKSYVSQQQDIELDGDIVVCGTQASGIVIDLSKAIYVVTQMAVTGVNNYACGEKDCLNKVERTERYHKKAQIKEKLERSVEQMQDMVKAFNALIVALDD